jgi:hypothetical protein
MNKTQKFKSGPVRQFLEFLFANDYHSKRVTSLADATLGVLQTNSLGIHAIGHGLSYARGLTDKHAIKQVDRLLSNTGIELWDMFDLWVPAMIGERKEIIVALDWSDFDDDDQTMLMLSLTTKHGRATPLVWRTVLKSELKGQKQQHEAEVVLKFMESLSEGVRVTLLADRGFDDHKFMDFLHDLCGFDFVIRFRGGTVVESDKGESRQAKDWVGRGGRARMLKNAKITKKGYEVATVVCMQDKQMKEPWCLASSRSKEDAKAFAKWYAKRWSIESSFRDLKDPMYGMGLGRVRVKRCDRRDRLVLLAAFSIVLMTLLGAAGENLGFDRFLKANTTKKRTHSLLRQGYMWYNHIPNMPEERLRPLMREFDDILQQHSVFKKVFGWV